MCHDHDATESAAIVSGIINKTTTVELCITCIPTTCCGEIFYVHDVKIAHVTLTTPT